MIYYIVFAAIAVGVLIVFGVPAVTAMVKIPMRTELRVLGPEEVTAAAQNFFGRIDREVAALGYFPVTVFHLAGQGTPNENRLYWNDAEATALLASHFLAGGRSLPTLEFTTEFSDGTEVSTGNAQVSLLFDRPPWQDTLRLPAIADPARLLEAHRERIVNKRSGGAPPRRVDPGALLEEIKRSIGRQLAHQVERGLFRPDEEAGVFRATPKIALRGVSTLLNPFADEFTAQRFALGFGLGFLLFMGAALAVGNFELSRMARELLPRASEAQLAFALYAPGFILGGLAVGLAFPSKGFLWGFLLSLPAILLVGAEVREPIFYTLVAAQAGKVANTIREVRAPGPNRAKLSTAMLVLGALLVGGYFYLD